MKHEGLPHRVPIASETAFKKENVMTEEAAVGGSGKSGQALRDELRGPERSDEENAKRLLSGEA